MRPSVPGWQWAAICLCGLAVSSMAALQCADRSSDFNQFFAAGQLAGTGHLYDLAGMRRVRVGIEGDVVPFGRLPVFAAAFKPLTYLPRGVARLAWLSVNVTALAVFVVLWPFCERRHVLAFVCWSNPVAILLSTGQDTGLFLLFAAMVVRFLRQGQLFYAGLACSLCANKFHLAAGLVLLLAGLRAWRAILGGICGSLAILAACFVIEGAAWPIRLIELSHSPLFTPAPYKNPNLLGFSYWLPASTVVECVLGIGVFAGVYWLARRASLEVAASAALVGGLLTGHHAYVYDCVLMIPALVLSCERPPFAALRIWSLGLAIPAAYTLLLEPVVSVPAQFAITGFSLVFIAASVFVLPPPNLICHFKRNFIRKTSRISEPA